MLSVTSYSESAAATPETPAVRHPAGGWFSPTLFRKNLSRFWPLWAAYALLWLILWPAVQFVTAFGRNSWYESTGQLVGTLARDTLTMGVQAGLWIAIFAGALFAIALFSYTTSPRSVSMYHSFPIRREGLFLTNYLTGLIVTVGTLGLSILLTAAVQLAAGAFTGAVLVQAFLYALGHMVFFYSFAVLCASITGHILLIPVFYGVFNVLALGLCFLVQALGSAFYFGYNESTPEWIAMLTPVEYLSRNVWLGGGYYQASNSVGSTFTAETWIPAENHGGVILLAYAAVGLVMAALALMFYRHRASETAGDVVSIRWARPVFRYGVALCAALSLGQGLYYILWEAFVGGSRVSLPGLLLCMAAMGLVGFYGAEMLLKKSFRVLRRSWKGAAGFVVALVAVGLCANLDILGVEDRLPQAEQVEYASMDINNRGGLHVGFGEEETEGIQLVRDLHAAILAEKDTFVRRQSESYWDGADLTYMSFRVTYALKNGSTLRRSYTLWYPAEETKTTGTAMAAMAQAISSPLVQHASLDISNLDRFVGGDLGYVSQVDRDENGERVGYTQSTVSFTAQQAEEIYAAIGRDIDAGHFGKNQLDDARWTKETYVNILHLYYVPKLTPDAVDYNNPGTRDLRLEFSSNATELIATLEEMGLVTEGRPLVTREVIESRDSAKIYGFTGDGESTVAEASAGELSLPEATNDTTIAIVG